MWRGVVIVVLAVGSFLIFPLECSGPDEGPARCRSVAGLTYSPGWVVAGLWIALAAALIWLAVAKLRGDRRPRRVDRDPPRV